METIGVGLIGTGYMGKCHALAWTAVRAVFGDGPVVRRVALCEVEEGLARRRADEFGFETATADWKALVSNPAVDVVSITTPTGLHAPMAIAALEAGKHVWCEKPMAPSLAEAERMAGRRARERQGRDPRLQLHPEPGGPLHRQASEAGAIGRVTQFRVEMDEDFMADPEAPFSWRSEANSGLGALDDFAVHPMSLISTLFGMPSEAFGELGKPYPRPAGRRGRRAVENYDIATALLRMDGGASGAIQVSRSAWGRKGRIAAPDFRRARRDRLRPGAVQRGRRLSRRRADRGPGHQDRADGPGPPALRSLHSRRRPPARASTTSRSSRRTSS